MRCFCGLRFGRFFASVLVRVIQISEKWQARQRTRLGWRIPMHMWFIFALVSLLISKSNYSFFEGAHFAFQAKSIRMRDYCLLRFGSKQLLKVQAEF